MKALKKYFSYKLFSNLLILWFLLFPFDANIFSFSIGFMTVYPFLILTFFLLGYSFLGNEVDARGKYDNWVILFFFIWSLYGISFYPFVKGKTHAYYEIKSLLMMAFTVWLVFRMKYILGGKSFFQIFHKFSLFIFIMYTIVGLCEYFTGIHFAGKFTEKLWNLPAEMTTYAPVFLYDNPNNFMCYMFGTAIIYFLTDFDIKPSKILLITFILFFFSVITESRFGKCTVFILIIGCIVISLIKNNFRDYLKYIWWVVLVIGCLIITFLSKPVFYGPMWQNEDHYVLNSLTPVRVDSNKLYFYPSSDLVKEFGETRVAKEFWNYQMGDKMFSISIRKNLILNGLYIFKTSKGIGVGPGQYRYIHEQKQNLYPVTTITSPHDGSIEILSQYGLPIFIPCVLLFLFFWLMAFKKRKYNLVYFTFLSICFMMFVIISDMPSAFLNLNIGWIIIPLLVLSASNFYKSFNDRSDEALL